MRSPSGHNDRRARHRTRRADELRRRGREQTRRLRQHGAGLRHRNLLRQVVRKADACTRIKRSRKALRGQAEKARRMVSSARRRAQRSAQHR